ncbi:hypothetical protein AB4876_13710 [Zhongshania guokunii]|jgi:ankyrin repeat protein|uniref:Ankyrin repeat protein n=1 Tax=Zhongshania guokunii TaxID=641783 RepID=A0ABV3U9P7_9GAMM
MRISFFAFALLFISGCTPPYINSFEIGVDIAQGRTDKLKEFNSNSFVRNAQSPDREPYEVTNATESAVLHNNIEAIHYLISIDAIHPVSAQYQDDKNNTHYSPVNVPAAEYACGVGSFEIMALLQEHDQTQTVNYTNCLHYILYSQNIRFIKKASPDELNSRIEKVISLGGDINKAPEYGQPLQAYLFDDLNEQNLSHREFISRLELLEKNGLEVDTTFSYAIGKETLLGRLSYFEDENSTAELAKTLVKLGADVNKVVNRSIIIGFAEQPGSEYKYQNRDVTALHMARFYDRNKLAETLIALGADDDIKDDRGYTSKDYAGVYAKVEAARKPTNNTPAQQEDEDSIFGNAINILGIGSAILGY